MTTELDRIKFKIKALAAKTVANGCSEHEAMSAMEGVGRLLAQYNLTMEECDVRSSVCKTIFIDIDRQHRHPIDSCVTSLADLVNAKCWFNRQYKKYPGPNGGVVYKKSAAYAFFGQEQDLELIEYLFKVIHSAIEAESAKFKQSSYYSNGHKTSPEYRHRVAGARRSATVSFQRGMASRIGQRLRVLKAQNDAELAKHRSTGTALVVLKKQIIEDAWQHEGIKLRSNRSSYRIKDSSAFEHGHRAGDKVNLSRPIPGAGKVGGLLT